MFDASSSPFNKTDGNHVIIGTIQGVMELLTINGSQALSGLKALIVDDITCILESPDLIQDYLAIIKMIYSVHHDLGK